MCERRVCVWLWTYLSLLGYRIPIRWGLGNTTVSDPCYDMPEMVLFHWHEKVRAGQTWYHVLRTFLNPMYYGSSRMSRPVCKELCSSSWATIVWNSFRSVTLLHLPRCLQIVFLGNPLKRARLRWSISAILQNEIENRYVRDRGWRRCFSMM